ncbi:hypothetical protein J45TS6_00540 [Paenibacillus sp. J45TS6]|nr:hypothetical protein J45TS6_00540 [Paenibacillus sp. J45TS6]
MINFINVRKKVNILKEEKHGCSQAAAELLLVQTYFVVFINILLGLSDCTRAYIPESTEGTH